MKITQQQRQNLEEIIVQVKTKILKDSCVPFICFLLKDIFTTQDKEEALLLKVTIEDTIREKKNNYKINESFLVDERANLLEEKDTQDLGRDFGVLVRIYFLNEILEGLKTNEDIHQIVSKAYDETRDNLENIHLLLFQVN